jgi:two-component system, cell cycle sensor histidine kinase and response regulator CckA
MPVPDDQSAPAAFGMAGMLYQTWPQPDGTVRVEYLSAEADQLLEMTADDLSARLSAQTLPLTGVDADTFFASVRDSIARHEPWTAEFGYVGPRTGRVRWLRAHDFPCVSPSGERYFAGVLLDITALRAAQATAERAIAERAEAERQLAEARHFESLGVLLGSIAHDFNNLLTVILGNASVVRSGTTDPNLALQMSGIETAAIRAAGLCNQLTTYAGGGRRAVEPVDLAALLADNAVAFAATAGPAALRIDAPPDLPAVAGDPRLLRQMLHHLISNGAEAVNGGGGCIDVLVEPAAADRVRIRVTDNGHGMDADTRARVFEPFFTTKAASPGLGLTAVKGIVRAHKGTIRVDSEPGRGTGVEIEFPAAPVLSPARAAPAADDEAWAGRGALVVDDELNVRELIASVLEDDGYRVTVGANGTDAVALFAADPRAFAVAVVDLMMPGLTGDEVIRRLRRLRPGLPVIIVSGYTDRVLEDDVLTSGPTAVLGKPFRLEALTAAVRRATAPAGE